MRGNNLTSERHPPIAANNPELLPHRYAEAYQVFQGYLREGDASQGTLRRPRSAMQGANGAPAEPIVARPRHGVWFRLITYTHHYCTIRYQVCSQKATRWTAHCICWPRRRRPYGGTSARRGEPASVLARELGWRRLRSTNGETRGACLRRIRHR